MKTILILAFKLIKRQKFVSILLVLQVCIALIALNMSIGNIQYYIESAQLANTFSNTNAFYWSPYKYIDRNSFEISNQLSEYQNLKFSEGKISSLILYQNGDEAIGAYGYNDTIISSLSLKLSEGLTFKEYFSTSDIHNESIPAIATTSCYSVGDHIELTSIYNSKKILIEIIGVLAPDSYVMSFNTSANSGNSNLDYMISKPQFPLILPFESNMLPSISSSDCLSTNNLAKLIIVDNHADISIVNSILTKYGHTTYIDDLIANYQSNIKNELTIYSIILIIFTFLTVIGIGGHNVLQGMSTIKYYATFYMLGESQTRCALIEALRCMSLLILSFILISISFPFYSDLLFGNHCSISPCSYIISFIYIIIVFFMTSFISILKLGKEEIVTFYHLNGGL